MPGLSRPLGNWEYIENCMLRFKNLMSSTCRIGACTTCRAETVRLLAFSEWREDVREHSDGRDVTKEPVAAPHGSAAQHCRGQLGFRL